MTSYGISPFMLRLDRVCDYSPGISTISSITNLAQKILLMCSSTPPVSVYYAHIQSKSVWRSVILMVPIIGNITIWLLDYTTFAQNRIRYKVAKKLEIAGDTLFSKEPLNSAIFYNTSSILLAEENVPKSAELFYKKGKALSKTFLISEAIEHTKKALDLATRLDKDSLQTAQAHFTLGCLYKSFPSEERDPVFHLEKALAIVTKMHKSHLWRAQIHFELGTTFTCKTCIEHLQKALAIHDHLKSKQVTDLNKHLPEWKIVLNLASLLYKGIKVTAAHTLFNERAHLWGNILSEPPLQKAERLSLLGQYFHTIGNNKKAIECLKQVLRVRVSHSHRSLNTHRTLIKYLRQLNLKTKTAHLEEILLIYQEKESIYIKKIEEMHYTLAATYRDTKRFSHYQKAINLTLLRDPNSSELADKQLEFGKYLLETENIEEAFIQLKNALLIYTTENRSQKTGLCHHLLGLCYEKDNPLAALTHYQEGVTAHKKHSLVYGRADIATCLYHQAKVIQSNDLENLQEATLLLLEAREFLPEKHTLNGLICDLQDLLPPPPPP